MDVERYWPLVDLPRLDEIWHLLTKLSPCRLTDLQNTSSCNFNHKFALHRSGQHLIPSPFILLLNPVSFFSFIFIYFFCRQSDSFVNFIWSRPISYVVKWRAYVWSAGASCVVFMALFPSLVSELARKNLQVRLVAQLMSQTRDNRLLKIKGPCSKPRINAPGMSELRFQHS